MKRLALVIAVLVLAALIAGCGPSRDARVEAFVEKLEAHPMVPPELSFGEPDSYYVGPAGETATGLSSGWTNVRAFASFDVDRDRTGEAVAELRTQAEALGYEFTEYAADKYRADPIDGLPGTIEITELFDAVVFTISGTIT